MHKSELDSINFYNLKQAYVSQSCGLCNIFQIVVGTIVVYLFIIKKKFRVAIWDHTRYVYGLGLFMDSKNKKQ